MNSRILLCLCLAVVAVPFASAGILSMNIGSMLKSLSPNPAPRSSSTSGTTTTTTTTTTTPTTTTTTTTTSAPPPNESVTCPSVPDDGCRNFNSDQVVKMDLLGYLRTYTPERWYVPYSSKSVLTSYANSLNGTRDRSSSELDQLCLRDAFLTILCVSTGYDKEVDQICVPQTSMKLAQMCCQNFVPNVPNPIVKSYPASRITILKANADQSELLVVRCVNGQDDFKVLSKQPTISDDFEAQVNQTLRSYNFTLDDSTVGRQTYSNCQESTTTTTAAPTAEPSTESTSTTAEPTTTQGSSSAESTTEAA